jgi:cytochrome d ubiquinol oxidase subunit II
MITYLFLQHYWWFLIALLGGLLVFLLFVQGGNALIFPAGKREAERELIINSTGRK